MLRQTAKCCKKNKLLPLPLTQCDYIDKMEQGVSIIARKNKEAWKEMNANDKEK